MELIQLAIKKWLNNPPSFECMDQIWLSGVGDPNQGSDWGIFSPMHYEIFGKQKLLSFLKDRFLTTYLFDVTLSHANYSQNVIHPIEITNLLSSIDVSLTPSKSRLC